jgi:hypothetical protein
LRRTGRCSATSARRKGRYRQFHQLDAEVLGSDSPLADAELLVFADQLLKELGVAEGVTLTLNTLGDAESRDAWRAALVEHFEAHRGELSEDSLARLDKNPLRILDSKDPKDRPVADSAPDIDAFLTERGAGFLRRRHRRASTPRASRGSATRGSCAGSTIIATPRSSSSPTGWARRARCSAAGAMTG